MASKRSKSDQGFALIEVLVSLVIFSLGVVGLIGVQARALQVSTDAQDRSRAALLAQSLSSEMWVIKSTELSEGVVTAWKAQLKEALPNGEGDITQNTAGTDATISVKWLAPNRKALDKNSEKPSGEAMSQFITQVVIPQ